MVSNILLMLYIYCSYGDFIAAVLALFDFFWILWFCKNSSLCLLLFLVCTFGALIYIENEIDEGERGFWVCSILLVTFVFQRFYISGITLCLGAFVNHIYKIDLFGQSLPAFNDESWDAPLEDKLVLWTTKILIEFTYRLVFVSGCAGNVCYFARLFSPNFFALVPVWSDVSPFFFWLLW